MSVPYPTYLRGDGTESAVADLALGYPTRIAAGHRARETRRTHRITALSNRRKIGGFLEMDTKDVAAPFKAIHATMKDNKWWLVMNTTKDALETAPGYRYDTNSTMWV
jgi:hypothetical protein